MKKKYRFIMYGVLIALPIISQVSRPDLPLWEPLSFIGLVLVAALVIEIYSYRKGLK